VIHYNTSNVSAVKMSLILEDMGIKNNKFMLELLDEDLLDVNPFADDLTLLQKAKITHEIINNPWYYIREIVRIPTGGGLTPFEIHRGNLALIWAILNNISSFVIFPRQCYKTTSICAIYSYLFYWGSVHNRMCFIAHEDAAVKKNLQGVKDIRDNLPQWLNMFDKNDRDNEKEMYNFSADNRVICRAPARNADAARKSGRGLSTPIQFFDEVAFIPYIYDMYDSISFAYGEVAKAAKRNGAPYHQVMATTAGFLNTPEGKWAHNFLNSCADFTELFYDMDITIVKDIIENGSTSGFLALSFMYYDLSKGDDYFDEQKKRVVNSLNPKDTLDREVLNIWKEQGVESPLGQERLERLISLVHKPRDYIVINNTYTMRVYVDIDKFNWNKPLVGGMDLSGNLKNDFSTLVITDPSTFEVIAVLRSNSQSTMLFALAIVSIMTDLCSGLILFPERNYNGAVIDTIVSYVRNSKRRVYHENDDADRPGLFNSKKIRPILFNSILKVAIDEHGHKIHDKNIIEEIGSLIRLRNGRIDHPQNGHDDTLIAYLLSLYFLLYIENVGLYFDRSIILNQIPDNNIIIKPGDSSNSMSQRKKEILGMSYLNLMNSTIPQSIDDIANVMMDSSTSSANIRSTIIRYDDADISNLEKLESSDSLAEVRSDIDKMNDENKSREVFINKNESKGSNSDFNSVFGSIYKNNPKTPINFKSILGW